VINISEIVSLFIDLIKNMAVVIVLAYVLTRTKAFSAMLKKQTMIIPYTF
jgi:LytS/YehU family sensor histidine kinase